MGTAQSMKKLHSVCCVRTSRHNGAGSRISLRRGAARRVWACLICQRPHGLGGRTRSRVGRLCHCHHDAQQCCRYNPVVSRVIYALLRPGGCVAAAGCGGGGCGRPYRRLKKLRRAGRMGENTLPSPQLCSSSDSSTPAVTTVVAAFMRSWPGVGGSSRIKHAGRPAIVNLLSSNNTQVPLQVAAPPQYFRKSERVLSTGTSAQHKIIQARTRLAAVNDRRSPEQDEVAVCRVGCVIHDAVTFAH